MLRRRDFHPPSWIAELRSPRCPRTAGAQCLRRRLLSGIPPLVADRRSVRLARWMSADPELAIDLAEQPSRAEFAVHPRDEPRGEHDRQHVAKQQDEALRRAPRCGVRHLGRDAGTGPDDPSTRGTLPRSIVELAALAASLAFSTLSRSICFRFPSLRGWRSARWSRRCGHGWPRSGRGIIPP